MSRTIQEVAVLDRAMTPEDKISSTQRERTDAWNFFISYTSADRVWAEWIAWELEDKGYHVLFQAWDFVPGSHWTTRMAEGVQHAEHTLAIISEAYLQSVYGREEWQAAYRADPGGLKRRLIPIRIENCPRPELLGGIVSFDLFERTEEEARHHLHSQIQGAVRGRAKPAGSPSFPSRSPGDIDRNEAGLIAPKEPRLETAPTFPESGESSGSQPVQKPPRKGWSPRKSLLAISSFLALTVAAVTIYSTIDGDGHPSGSGAPASTNTPSSPPGHESRRRLELHPLGSEMISAGQNVNFVEYAPSGRVIASGSEAGIVELRSTSDVADTHEVRRLNCGTEEIGRVAFSPAGNLLAAGSYDGLICTWDISDPQQPRPRHQFQGSGAAGVSSLDFDRTGRSLAIGSYDGTSWLWDLSGLNARKSYGLPLTPRTDKGYGPIVEFAPNSATLAVAGNADNGTIKQWDTSDPTNPLPLGVPLEELTEPVIFLSFSPDGKTLASTYGGREGRTWLWNVSNPDIPKRLKNPIKVDTPIMAAAFGPKEGLFATGSSDGAVQLWNVSDLENPQKLGSQMPGHSEFVATVDFTPEGDVVVSGGGRSIRLWSIS